MRWALSSGTLPATGPLRRAVRRPAELDVLPVEEEATPAPAGAMAPRGAARHAREP